MIIAVAERVFNPDLDWTEWSNARVSWRMDRLSAILDGPAMNTNSGVLKRLHSMLGFKPDKVMNLLPPSKVIGSWDKHEAAKSAVAVLKWVGWQRSSPIGLVYLGRRVCTAFGYDSTDEWGEIVDDGPMPALIMPHPSGRNRTINDRTIRSFLLERSLKFQKLFNKGK